MALVTVDHIVLEALVWAAITDATADEVTPPLTAGPGWTPIRIAWLRDFHGERRAGLDGPAREATWAITVDRQVVGSVRLRRTERPGMLETGVWLTRGARGHGVGRVVMGVALREAAALGFTSVWAGTTASNASALTVLERLGFDLTPTDDGRGVHALLVLKPQS
ncbi:MAG: GNAT family N-acetyltransferase [Nocardioidaceae bacterium]